ncbi:MAG: helix-hairpin-helix domain-containing protein [Epsilonproteobacteria bacterium]|nr:helix-hairpin-helix domain-containing protein [Campylobacterota bacterium]
MVKKILLTIIFLSASLFAAINLQTASKEELMSIAGIGAKRADAIIKYRKTHRIKSADDLLNIKGIGKNVVYNVKKGIKNKKRVASKSKVRTKTKKRVVTKTKANGEKVKKRVVKKKTTTNLKSKRKIKSSRKTKVLRKKRKKESKKAKSKNS